MLINSYKEKMLILYYFALSCTFLFRSVTPALNEDLSVCNSDVSSSVCVYIFLKHVPCILTE